MKIIGKKKKQTWDGQFGMNFLSNDFRIYLMDYLYIYKRNKQFWQQKMRKKV